MVTSVYPKYLVLHADINETAIAGDGAKGYSGEQALRIVASKYVPATNGKPFYKTVEADLKGKPKHEIEQAVLDFVEQHSEDPVVNEIKEKAKKYSQGCEEVSLGGGRSILVLKTFVDLLQKVNASPHVARCLCLFRTNGPDMGDLLSALQTLGLLQSDQQWRGYGEFQYTKHDGTMVVNNHLKPAPEAQETLSALAKANQPAFTPSLLWNAAFDPTVRSIAKEFYVDEGPQLANEALAVPQGLQRIISDVMCHTAGPKLQFAGLREVFLVWQRYNRHHGKPFYCVEGATGAKPEDPVQLFLDDNAYEEEPKGKPGPYIVTVHKRQHNDVEYTAAPIEATHAEVIRPGKEEAYTDPGYYDSICAAACNTVLAKAKM